jgi:hypothetical protein
MSDQQPKLYSLFKSPSSSKVLASSTKRKLQLSSGRSRSAGNSNDSDDEDMCEEDEKSADVVAKTAKHVLYCLYFVWKIKAIIS